MSFDLREIYEMISKGQAEPLEDILDIEQAALLIKSMNDKIDFYKKLKKKRTQILDDEISNLSVKIDFLRQVILQTLIDNEEKTLTFPGVCKAGDRKGKDKYIIKDESSFIDFLRKEDKFDECVKVTTTEKVVKKEADKLLKNLDQKGKLPDSVEKEEATSGLQLTFEKEISKDFTDIDIDAKEDVKMDDFDGVGF